MFWGAVAIFILMMVLGFWAWRASDRVRGISGRSWIVYGGLVFPGTVILALLVSALVLGERLIPRALGEAPMRIEANARQWFWEFSYPDIPGSQTTIDVLHMPAGQPVDFVITSADVIHAFWIPRLGGKMDAIPGHANVLRLQADRPGIYHGICAEFCGNGHTDMRFSVEAHDDAAGLAAAVGPQGEGSR
jgi:cytochrome c oxidase subunit II